MASTKKNKAKRGRGAGSWLLNAVVHGLIRGALRLPYERRIPLAGWVTGHILAPLAGYDRRIRDNLALVCPDLPEAEVKRLQRAVPDNAARSWMEMYSGAEFIERVKDSPVRGPGLPVVQEAQAAGRPVVFVTGHFGNYDVARVVLMARGFRIGGLYNPMRNVYFNRHYVEALERIGKPVFPRGRRGLAELLRFLKSGGMTAFLVDLNVKRGVPLRFFGKPAKTALSAAELALKFDAPLVPAYGIRQPDGLSFEVVIEAPIPPGDPAEMMQAVNDSIEAMARDHMEQWFWIHRRWKA
ncbi:MAG: lysophospholipid acyltransferase family protein [Paracoccaceae bacterium]